MRSLLPAPAWVQTFVTESLEARERAGGPVACPPKPCPRCGMPLDLAGYRRTETSYLTEEVLRCQGCQGELLLSREQRV